MAFIAGRKPTSDGPSEARPELKQQENSIHQDPARELQDAERLAALASTELLGSPAEPEFDGITRLVSRTLKTPVALMSLVAEDKQFFKSACGLDEPWASNRSTPLSHSFCQ